MAPPVDHLGEHDAGGQRSADDEKRARAAAFPLGAPAELGRRWADRAMPPLPVGRGAALEARADEARLELAQEGSAVRELRSQFGRGGALGSRSVGEPVEAV